MAKLNLISRIEKRKKADVSILLLVIMTILLCATALYMFYKYGGSYVMAVKDYNALEQFYLEEGTFDNILYSNIILAINDLKSKNADIVAVKPEAFRDNFRANYFKEFGNAPEYKSLVEQLKKNEAYDISVSNNLLYFKIKDLVFESSLPITEENHIVSASINKTFSFEIPLK